MRIKARWIIGISLAMLICAPITGQGYQPTWESLDSRPIPSWFTEARFGIFIHWGVYSVPAWRPLSEKRYASYAEWYYARVLGDEVHGGQAFHDTNYGRQFEYRDFAPMFRAELFDPAFWADVLKRSGARYVVLTSKHHDGFCLWPTASPYKMNWNSVDLGPKRDLVGELTAAVRARGMRMGLYYSLVEWESSWTHRTESGYYIDKKLVDKYRIPEDRFVPDHILPQLKELVINYQPDLLFSDGGEWDGSEDYWQTREFLAWLYNDAPNRTDVVVNDRWAKDMPGKHGDYYSSEYQDTDAVGDRHPWEESRGIGGSYGFNRAESLDDYQSSGELVHELIDIVSRGGNLLLNVGPTADGRIPVIMQQRLKDIGDWLAVNGEAIYGTTPVIPGLVTEDFIRLTRTAGATYLICLKWPTEPFNVRGEQTKRIRKISLAGSDVAVEWRNQNDSLVITPPAVNPATIPCRYAYVFKMEE